MHLLTLLRRGRPSWLRTEGRQASEAVPEAVTPPRPAVTSPAVTRCYDDPPARPPLLPLERLALLAAYEYVLLDLEREFEQMPADARRIFLGALARVAARHDSLEAIG